MPNFPAHPGGFPDGPSPGGANSPLHPTRPAALRPHEKEWLLNALNIPNAARALDNVLDSIGTTATLTDLLDRLEAETEASLNFTVAHLRHHLSHLSTFPIFSLRAKRHMRLTSVGDVLISVELSGGKAVRVQVGDTDALYATDLIDAAKDEGWDYTHTDCGGWLNFRQ